MAYQANRNNQVGSDGQSPQKTKKERNRENTKELAEDAGTVALEGLGVPGPLAGMATNEIAKNPLVDKTLNKVSDKLHKNPIASKAINTVAESPAKDAVMGALGGKIGGGSGGNVGANANTTSQSQHTTTPGAHRGSNNNNNNSNNNSNGNGDSSGRSLLGKNSPFSKGNNRNTDNQTQQGEAKTAADSIGHMVQTIKKIPPFLWPVIGWGLFIFFIIICVVAVIAQFTPMFGTTTATGEGNGGIEYVVEDPDSDEGKFYAAVDKVKDEYKANGKDFEGEMISSVYFIMNRHDENFTFEDMDEDEIRDLADMMFKDPVIIKTCEKEGESAKTVEGADTACPAGFTENEEKRQTIWTKDEATFKSNLKDQYIKEKLPDLSEDEIDSVVDEIYEYISNYHSFIEGDTDASDNSSNGQGECTFSVDNQVATNIKVRLLKCDTSGEAIEGEELVDFEKYILGVTYAENEGAPTESLKAQAIAARSYALTRGKVMGGAYNVGLKQEDGQWILSLRNCTSDQVYCDPDKGCWADGKNTNTTVHSGQKDDASNYKGPLAADSPIRTAVQDVTGKVLVDSVQSIIATSYTDTNQQRWTQWANEGLDHFEILQKDYSASNPKQLLSNCVLRQGGSSGNYAQWKQYGSSWSSIPMGTSGKNVGQIGCLVTSIAIQIAHSQTALTVSNFDPGVFVRTLNANGGISSTGNFMGTGWQSLAPNWVSVGSYNLTGSKAQKASQLQEQVSKGYYVVIRAKTNQHWVALDYVDGETVYMFDPGSSAVKLWDKYPASDVTRMLVYKKTD